MTDFSIGVAIGFVLAAPFVTWWVVRAYQRFKYAWEHPHDDE